MGVHINTTQIITKMMEDKCENILSFSPCLFLISNVFNVYVHSKFFQPSFDVMHRCGVWCVGGVEEEGRVCERPAGGGGEVTREIASDQSSLLGPGLPGDWSPLS